MAREVVSDLIVSDPAERRSPYHVEIVEGAELGRIVTAVDEINGDEASGLSEDALVLTLLGEPGATVRRGAYSTPGIGDAVILRQDEYQVGIDWAAAERATKWGLPVNLTRLWTVVRGIKASGREVISGAEAAAKIKAAQGEQSAGQRFLSRPRISGPQ